MASIIPAAGALQKNAIQKNALKTCIVEILKRLRDELQIARQQGEFTLTTSLPIQFEIPNMRNNDSQRIIWSSVIKAFVEQGYRVNLNPQNNTCAIKIRWISDADENEVKAQIDLIAHHTDKEI